MQSRLIPLLALLLAPGSLAAQLTGRVSAGATAGTSLISEAVLYEDVASLKTSVAPTVTLALGYPISPTHRLLAELRLASATLTGEGNAGSNDLGALRTIELAVLVDAPLPYHLRLQVGGGAIKYAPSRRVGAFLDDAPIKPMVTGGVSWTRVLGEQTKLEVGGRWGLHEFTTKSLERRGYSLAQRVHRLGLTVGLERAF